MTGASSGGGWRIRLATGVVVGVLSAALGATGAWAADDDASAVDGGSMIVQVTVPAHRATAPSPAGPGAVDGSLPRTGLDASALLPWLIAGLGAVGGGAAAVALRRRAQRAV